MRDVHQRAFIALDEWLGILISIILFERGSALFWPFAITWAVAVYAISYPLHWGWWQALRVRRQSRRAAAREVAAATREVATATRLVVP